MYEGSPLLSTRGAGVSAHQDMQRRSGVLTAAGSMALPAQVQGLAGADDARRLLEMDGNTGDHRQRTALQHTQTAIAQAPKNPQQLVMEHKLKAMQCCGMEPKFLDLLGRTMMNRAA